MQEFQRYKQSEIGKLPDEWEVKKLGDILELCQYGLSIKLSRNGQYPVFRMNNIANGKVLANDLKYVDLNKEVFEQYKLEKGDILFNRTNSYDLVGKVGIFLLDGNYTFASYLIRIRANSQLSNALFLNYYLNSEWIQDRLRNLATRGVSQSNINSANLRSIDVAVPTLKEQAQIASILSKVDDLIQKVDEIIEQTQRLKKGLMQRLLTRGINHTKFKQTEIGKIPEEWSIIKLGNACTISTGTTPSTSILEYYNGDIPFIRTSEIDNRPINKATTFISKKAVEDYNLKVYPPGTVFLAMYGQGKTRGKVAMLAIEATTSQNTAAIVTDHRLLDPLYLFYYLRNNYQALRVEGIIGHISHLNLSAVKSLNVIIPPIEEQKGIISIMLHVDAKIEKDQQEQRVLIQLKKGLMQKLLAGKIRVKV